MFSVGDLLVYGKVPGLIIDVQEVDERSIIKINIPVRYQILFVKYCSAAFRDDVWKLSGKPPIDRRNTSINNFWTNNINNIIVFYSDKIEKDIEKGFCWCKKVKTDLDKTSLVEIG